MIASRMCLREVTLLIGLGPHRVVEDLGGDHDLVTSRHVLQRASQHLLAFAQRVHVSGVEEVDAVSRAFADEGLARLSSSTHSRQPRSP